MAQAEPKADDAKKKLVMEERISHYGFWFNFDVAIAVLGLLLALGGAGLFFGSAPGSADLPLATFMAIIGVIVLIAGVATASSNHGKRERLRKRLFAGVYELV